MKYLKSEYEHFIWIFQCEYMSFKMSVQGGLRLSICFQIKQAERADRCVRVEYFRYILYSFCIFKASFFRFLYFRYVVLTFHSPLFYTWLFLHIFTFFIVCNVSKSFLYFFFLVFFPYFPYYPYILYLPFSVPIYCVT